MYLANKNIETSLVKAKEQADKLPDILAQAKQIAHSIMAGWHGRKQAGDGDVFWQFRAYNQQESTKYIDWRRSAKDNALTIKEQEWQAAISFWLWADNSTSMHFRSKAAPFLKQEKALILILALAEILARSGERVGYPSISKAQASKKSAEIIAARLQQEKPTNPMPPLDKISNGSNFIIASDFLLPIDKISDMINKLASRNITGMFIHIIDPAEINFPFAGHTEFSDMQGDNKIIFGRAQNIKQEYEKLFTKHKQQIENLCKKVGWFYIAHQTNESTQNSLIKAHTMLDKGK